MTLHGLGRRGGKPTVIVVGGELMGSPPARLRCLALGVMELVTNEVQELECLETGERITVRLPREAVLCGLNFTAKHATLELVNAPASLG